MNRIYAIYDDREMPSGAIRTITGEKSFGSIIYRRQTLLDRTRSYLRRGQGEKTFSISGFQVLDEAAFHIRLRDIPPRSAIIHIFSDTAVCNEGEFQILLRKTAYIRENYVVKCQDRPAAILFHSAEEWAGCMESVDSPSELRKLAQEFEEISCDAFADLSDRDHFLQFITSGFEARFFNSLSGNEHMVVKRSSNIKKIREEHDFYYLLPDRMKYWFVQPYDYREEGGQASYCMERMHMSDLAIRYVHGAISLEEFERILGGLFRFLSERDRRAVSWEAYYEKKKALYITKLEQRILSLKEHADFPALEQMIRAGTGYAGIDQIISEYEAVYDSRIGKHEERLEAVAGHGDLCFSNILYSPDSDLIRLIDPKGATKEEDIYTDPYYDVAKLSHSVCGAYDFMNSGLYEVVMGEDLKLYLRTDGDLSSYIEIFKRLLMENHFDYSMTRLYECSLFLSMLPLHMDRPQKVMAFVLNAIQILKEIQNE